MAQVIFFLAKKEKVIFTYCHIFQLRKQFLSWHGFKEVVVSLNEVLLCVIHFIDLASVENEAKSLFFFVYIKTFIWSKFVAHFFVASQSKNPLLLLLRGLHLVVFFFLKNFAGNYVLMKDLVMLLLNRHTATAYFVRMSQESKCCAGVSSLWLQNCTDNPLQTLCALEQAYLGHVQPKQTWAGL